MTPRRMAAAVAVTALAAVPGSAAAAPVQDLTVTISPSKASSVKAPRSATLRVSTGTRETTPGVQPPVTTSVDLYFPAGSRYNGALFPSCAPELIAAERTVEDCPRGAVVGSGRANGLAPGPLVQTDLRITAVNGGRNRISLFVEGASPLRIQSTIIGRVSGARGDFGLKLRVPIPQNLQEPAPGVPVTITLFEVRLGASRTIDGRRRGIIEVTRCRSGRWRSRGVYTYAGDAPRATVNVSQRCRR